ncbi:MAG: hypothetical protein AAF393_00025 [Pseudomonadota bacterium]
MSDLNPVGGTPEKSSNGVGDKPLAEVKYETGKYKFSAALNTVLALFIVCAMMALTVTGTVLIYLIVCSTIACPI